MLKYHKFISVAIALLYIIVLQEFTVPYPIFRFLAPALIGFCVLVTYYNKQYLMRLGKYNLWVLSRPVLMFLSGFGIFLLLPNALFRGLFLMATFFIIYLFEYNLGNFAENLLINETLIIAFGFFVAFCGFGQYFLTFAEVNSFFQATSLPDWEFSLQPVYLAGVFLSSYLLARAFFEFIPQSASTKTVTSVILALFCTEIYWALTFLPFHYSAMAVVLLSIFYFCLMLNYYYLFRTLTFKKVQFHLILIAIASSIAIIATPWKVLE